MSSSSSSSSATETLTLIPGLPNDISSLILSLIPFSHHARLKSTSKSWQSFLSSHQPFLVHRSIRTHGPHHPTLLCIFPEDPSITPPYLFDPSRLTWTPLPLLPCSPHRYGLCNFLSVSLGPHLYVLGGSLFDARSFPIDRPRPSSSVYRLDLPSSSPFSSWARLPSMLSPRGSFACAADPTSNSIVVAGGGSRHTLFRAAGTRLRSVERYDIEKDEWIQEEGLPMNRAGCVGFLVGEEFWVMGGYGACRMVSGVFPVDEHYRDAVALNLKTGKWREIGDMWVDGEGSRRLGTVVLVDRVVGEMPWIFMLDGSTIFKLHATRSFIDGCGPAFMCGSRMTTLLEAAKLKKYNKRKKQEILQKHHPIPLNNIRKRLKKNTPGSATQVLKTPAVSFSRQRP
ncbi:F-box/kelch-repeat protein OR23 isoform X2 [Magnolia sinica]|uniref:F-box/kelch-repeat protein OR23 isoform X2 n=1 Tax=Magnolia sinica TaxID=86752 RepID=UPI00265AF559|nr:F-box/kelch-repeat protein OR23 isoform X2 [Magnolia sinica]